MTKSRRFSCVEAAHTSDFSITFQEYNNSLMLNDHVRSVDAKDYILRVIFEESPKRHHVVDNEMREIFTKYGISIQIITINIDSQFWCY